MKAHVWYNYSGGSGENNISIPLHSFNYNHNTLLGVKYKNIKQTILKNNGVCETHDLHGNCVSHITQLGGANANETQSQS